MEGGSAGSAATGDACGGKLKAPFDSARERFFPNKERDEPGGREAGALGGGVIVGVGTGSVGTTGAGSGAAALAAWVGSGAGAEEFWPSSLTGALVGPSDGDAVGSVAFEPSAVFRPSINCKRSPGVGQY